MDTPSPSESLSEYRKECQRLLRERDMFRNAVLQAEHVFYITDKNGTLQLAERICSITAQHAFSAVNQVTVSCGATCLCARDSEEQLLKRADDALYRAKHNGRNRVDMIMPDTV